MIRYPQVQKKVQDELDQVIGTDKHPSLQDRPKLPYTEVHAIKMYIVYILLTHVSRQF